MDVLKIDIAEDKSDEISPNDLFKSLFSLINEFAYIVNTEYKIIYANEKSISSFGRNNFLNQNLFSVFPGTTKEKSVIARVMETGIPVRGQHESYTNIWGQRKESITRTYPIKENGKVVSVFQIGEDITGISNLSDQVMSTAIMQRKLDNSTRYKSRKSKKEYYSIDSIIGRSDCIKQLKEDIYRAAQSNANLMIYGETGTGKELVAQAVYSLFRTDESLPFIAQNCAAIPETLLESMLFGTVKGAYTGAENRSGLFELANDGVMFLDEMNSLPVSLQAKMLRVLDESRVRPVGGTNEINLNFRLFSSFNIAPQTLLKNGGFRMDLFYRLNVLSISIPPLRQRLEDIPLLVNCFINEHNKNSGRHIDGISEKSLRRLGEYDWPGNVRELKNYIERTLSVVTGSYIELRHLPETFGDVEFQPVGNAPFKSHTQENRIRFRDFVAAAEIDIIKDALRKTGGNISRAARDLDIPQQTLDGKIKKYSLSSFVAEIKN